MTRVDLYGTVHKGLRALLYETAATVARTDFSRMSEAAAALDALGRALAYLRSHADHEDEAILPQVSRHAPELGADLRADHARLHGLEDELRKLAARCADAGSAERVALGRRLHAQTSRLVADHSLHMLREEQDANRVLWAHLRDEELAAIEGRIVGSIPESELAGWMALILPEINHGERVALLAGLIASVPAAVFHRLTDEARWRMGPEAWDEALADVAALRGAAAATECA